MEYEPRLENLHLGTRGDKLGGHWHGLRGRLRATWGTTTRQLHHCLFSDYGSNEPDRVRLSIRKVIAVPCAHLDGAARWIYVVGTVVSLYLNVSALIVQASRKYHS